MASFFQGVAVVAPKGVAFFSFMQTRLLFLFVSDHFEGFKND